MRLLLLGIATLTFICCSTSNKQQENSISLSVKNIPIDSIGIRLLHFIEGREIIDTLISTKDSIILPLLTEDMYIVSVYWPRTFVPHQNFKKNITQNTPQESYSLSKPFYINTKESKQYVFKLPENTDILTIETSELTALVIDNKNCNSCQIAEQYWADYNDFFKRKEKKVEDLKKQMYMAIDARDTIYKNIYQSIINQQNNFWDDNIYLSNFLNQIGPNSNHAVNSFFLFFNLYQHRDFDKYSPHYEKLKMFNPKSKYFSMVKNQYEKMKSIEQ